ncbi:hypothetical protein TCAL_09674 [Tigriopus californicus]|uniref:Ionotropic glutamate receptor C-terminal domain-containing protein n=1 Tax=Tigriopus californicus TaxID=6832 RepID=A0A553P0E6_TIGCA|nr:hypothetical protein TCAL_09674 [Tigriopus californicus]
MDVLKSSYLLVLLLFRLSISSGQSDLAKFIYDFCRRHSINYFSFVGDLDGPTSLIQHLLKDSNLKSLYQSRFYPNLHERSVAKTLNIALSNLTTKANLLDRMELKLKRDFWLVQIPHEETVESYLKDLPLDLDDDFFSFYIETDSTIRIQEAYKLTNDMEPITLYFGSWTLEGLNASPMEKWDRRGDLGGMEFKISGASSSPYVKVLEKPNGEVEMSGMYLEIFYSLEEVMNFTHILNLPTPREEWGIKASQIQRGDIDFAPISFTRTKLRSEVVDFALPIAQFHHRYFVQNPRDSFNWFAYVEPLTSKVWLTIGLLSLIFPPFLTFLAFMPYISTEEERQEFTLWKSFVFVLSTLTFVRGLSVTPNQARNRLVFLGILFGGTVIFWHWEAMIISYLAVRIPALPFNNLEELLSQTNKKILIKPGSAYVDDFRYSLDPLIQEAWNTRIREYLHSYPNNRDELTDLVANDPDYVLYDNFYSSRTYGAYRRCQIIDVPQIYDQKVFAYGFQKNSPFLPIFNFHLKRMLERGSMNQVVEKYLSVAGQQCQDLSGAPLGFENCFTAFLLFLIGCLVSVVIIFGEYFARFLEPTSDAAAMDESDFYESLNRIELVNVLRHRDRFIAKLKRLVHDSDS